MKKTIIFSLLLCLSFVGNTWAKCGQVSIAMMGWTSAEVEAAIAKFLLEQGYGCKVKLVPSDTVPAVTSLAENNEPDIVLELWYGMAPGYPKLEKAGKIIMTGEIFSKGGVNAWWLPKYLADQYPQLTTIEGIFKNPELVGATFNNCPDGWACRVVNDNLIKALNLEKHGIKVFNHGSGETLAASIASAYADKKPWFGHYWGPTSIMGKYPMVRVKIGEFDLKNYQCLKQKVCDNPKVSEFPPSKVGNVVTKSFSKKNPTVFEFVKKFQFENQVVNEFLAWKEDNNASADETAAYFIKNYSDVWRQWFSPQAKKKLAKLL